VGPRDRLVARPGAAGDQWSAALGLLQELRSRGLPEDAFTLSAAVGACGSGLQWSLALELGEATQLDMTARNALVAACAQGGQWASGLGLLERMRKELLVPDAVACGAALSLPRPASSSFLEELQQRGVASILGQR